MIQPLSPAAAAASAPLRVGIVGLGRSGWNIHAKTLATLPARYRVAAVTDPEEARCREAREVHGCRVHPDFDALVVDPDLDLIVVASPNHLHVDHCVAAVAAGKHVVAEKPFALSVTEAERAITAAERYDRVIAPFQHRRYEPHFEKVRAIMDSGALGRIVHVRLNWHQFTRRWDWQTLRRFGGGLLNNNGSHLLDHALQLFPPEIEPDVFADLQQVLTLGDTEDHVKIVLKSPGQPTIDVELSNASAFAQDRWLVLGSAGGLRGNPDRLEWRTVNWADQPERKLETAAASGREYATDKIDWTSHVWTEPADAPHAYLRFYEDLHATIRAGAPLVIDPTSVCRLIRTLERCYADCPALASP